MASLLSSHLEQISLCANSIAEIPFLGPGSFTNAILSAKDITALIRDTEAHERALFHLAPPSLSSKANNQEYRNTATGQGSTSQRRATGYAFRQPKNQAVAAVLGGDLYAKIQRQPDSREKGEVDVELLLQGAERLATVYPIAGASERITQLRRRHQQLEANVAHYEARVAEQSRELEQMNQASKAVDSSEETEEDESGDASSERGAPSSALTQGDWDDAEEEVKELEQKKRNLEARVTGMERDLGGLMR